MRADAARIATLRERPLHASLKRWYWRPGDRVEAPVDGYVSDLVRGNLLIEIQTRGFAGMKRKVTTLLAAGHRIRIIHPIAVDRWIVQLDDSGAVVSRRRSPRHGDLADLVGELVSFPALLSDPGLEIEVLLTEEEEYRHEVPGRCWRRRGWTVIERRLLALVDRVSITCGTDLAALLPAGLPSAFTTADLAAHLGHRQRIAEQLAYCLRLTGVIDAVGKRGKYVEYRLAAPAVPSSAETVVAPGS